MIDRPLYALVCVIVKKQEGIVLEPEIKDLLSSLVNI